MGDLKKLFVVTEAHEWDNPPEPQSGMDPKDVGRPDSYFAGRPGEDRPGAPPRWMIVQLDQCRKAFQDLEVAVGSGDMHGIGKAAYKLSYLAEKFTEGGNHE